MRQRPFQNSGCRECPSFKPARLADGLGLEVSYVNCFTMRPCPDLIETLVPPRPRP